MSRLIDADALLAKFNKKADVWTALTDEKTARDFELYCKVADAVEEMPTVWGWISVDDELPDAAGLGVLVNAVNRFGQDSIFIAFQGYGDFKWYTMDATKMTGDKDNSVNVAWKITHWMPILPPKEVKE